MSHAFRVLRPAVVTVLLLGWSPAAAWAQGETFTATASVKSAAGAQMTAPVTVVLTRLTTDKERATVVEALKMGGSPAVIQSLKSAGDVGYIEVGGRRTPVKYAYVRDISGGRMVTVIAPTPIAHLGAGIPDAKPKAGFDMSLLLLTFTGSASGIGELAPAVTIKVNEAGAIETQDYGTEAVRLTDVRSKK
jgi:hypothetical protein